MHTRDMINRLTDEFKKSLPNIVDGKATHEQQAKTLEILDSIGFYTARLMIFDNQEEANG